MQNQNEAYDNTVSFKKKKKKKLVRILCFRCHTIRARNKHRTKKIHWTPSSRGSQQNEML